tara:strand:- start:1071 stop:1505 length:435 start_codon:yes stop_codon:yes gene_type:complete
MKTWVKIDRATGAVLKTKRAAEIKRVFNKRVVWLELTREPPPPYDPDTHKIVRDVQQIDLSDLGVPVPLSAMRVEDWKIVALDAAELTDRTNDKIADLDSGLIRIVEDLAVVIAGGGKLDRASLPGAVWDKINERRVLRGESEV